MSGLEIVFGAHFLNREEPNQQRRTVPLSGLIWHENYNPQTLVNDVAIIQLPTPVTLNAFVQAISFAEGTNTFAGSPAVASGWGRFSAGAQSSEFLRFVRVDVISNVACRIRFPTIIQDSTSKFSGLMLRRLVNDVCFSSSVCTSGDSNVGACNGDSGGPLTVQEGGQSLLIGIASFVSGLGCESGWPTGFARVSSFVPWFRARM